MFLICSYSAINFLDMLDRTTKDLESRRIKGSGRDSEPDVPRFDRLDAEAFDDGWDSLAAAREEEGRPKTEVRPDRSRSVIASESVAGYPVRSVDQRLSRLRAWLHLLLCATEPRLSRPVAGPRFRDQVIWAKYDAPELLVKELARPTYRCSPIAFGANTDPYQPIERKARDHAKRWSMCWRAMIIR